MVNLTSERGRWVCDGHKLRIVTRSRFSRKRNKWDLKLGGEGFGARTGEVDED